MNAEQIRLEEASRKEIPWKKWGPYFGERQWGTVREDYSGVFDHSAPLPTGGYRDGLGMELAIGRRGEGR